MTKTADMEDLRNRAGEVAGLLKILSHPNRLLIACDLVEKESSVSEIETRTGVRQPVLSRELARLRAESLVATRRESKMIFYRLADERLALLIDSLCNTFGSPKRSASVRQNRTGLQKPRRTASRERKTARKPRGPRG